MVQPKRVTLVADELLGYGRMGGLGTATSFLAVALARLGHEVDVLYIGEPPADSPTADWSRVYNAAGVTVRLLPRSEERTEPSFFARARDVERSLRANPADVVITQDLAAPVYTALRLRQLGLGFDRTLFVVYCHGTRRWITDVARKVRVLPGALAVTVLEKASLELADVVVSPSAYLLDWMRNERWRLPQRSLVIPYLTRSIATGEAPPAPPAPAPIRRIAFFGRLEERKGLSPFVDGLNAVDHGLLRNVQLEFVGRATPAWTPDRLAARLSDETRETLRAVSFHTELDQAAALAYLAQPGTLAVIPSLEDNSPNAVYECLERGIPFVAGAKGGIAELVAPGDRARVLFDPTAHGVATALSRALKADEFAPATFAFDPQRVLEDWHDVLAQAPLPHTHASRSMLDVAIERRGHGGTPVGSSEWVVFLDDTDAPDEQLVETLARAQSATGADIVSCGIRVESKQHHYFLGDGGALGTLSNTYGTVALIRRSLLTGQTTHAGAKDPDWPLFATLVLSGAKIVSVPETLVTTKRRPGDVNRDPVGALAVVREFERRLPEEVHALARLATGLAAQGGAPASPAPPSRAGRLSRLLPRR